MDSKEGIAIVKLWNEIYKEYVKEQLLTKMEAFEMIANELGLYLNMVKEKMDLLKTINGNK
jgi:hypothetical protein